jgi:uncharacterized protein YjbI with pentapeptide repeats
VPVVSRPGILPPRLSPVLGSGGVALTDEATWADEEITGSFAGQQAAHVDVRGCRLRSARFTAAQLRRLRLADSVVEDSEFSGAVLADLAATRVEFRRCRMSGLIASGGHFRDVRFIQCRLDEANFRMTVWKRAAFWDCVLRGADFSSAELVAAQLEDCDLTEVEFSNAQLAGARLHGSVLDGLRGAAGLRGIVIGTDQVLPLALSVFAGLRIRVDDDPDDVSGSRRRDRNPP